MSPFQGGGTSDKADLNVSTEILINSAPFAATSLGKQVGHVLKILAPNNIRLGKSQALVDRVRLRFRIPVV